MTVEPPSGVSQWSTAASGAGYCSGHTSPQPEYVFRWMAAVIDSSILHGTFSKRGCADVDDGYNCGR